MKLDMNSKSLLKVILIGVISTLIAGFILLNYEYFFLRDGNSQASPRSRIFSSLDRSIEVSPVYKWSQFMLFDKKRYYKTFQIKLFGGDEGFPHNTAINVSTSTGFIQKITGSGIIKPRFPSGASAVSWSDKNYRDSNKTLFVDGPNSRLEAYLNITIISKGKEVPDDTVKLIVSPPGEVPVSIDYKTDVKWANEK